MGHLRNKLEWCLNKAKKESKTHHGLKEINPNTRKANEHIEKANHNLKAMIYLIRGDLYDWAINASFYSMYHCLLAILSKYGYESRNQECTFAVIEYLIETKKLDLDLKWLRKITSSSNEPKEESIINLREKFQYGTEAMVNETKIKQLLNDTKEFIDIVKEILKK